jgi:hypothetical protein
MQEIENILNQLQDEKAELHRYAEEAILEAQRIRDENEALVERVHDAEQASLEAKMDVVIAENNKLQEIAAEFDRSILELKLAEAEDAINEAAALRERITELEEENAGLTTTLQEMRSSSQQLQALAALESRAVASAAAQAAALGLPSSPTSKLIGNSSDTTPCETPSLYATPESSSLPGGRTPPPAGDPPADEPGATAYISAAGGGVGGDYAAKDPARLADQLVAATRGAGAATDGGIVGHAAKLLRGYAAIDAELATQKAECERLRGEVDRMQETMSSKTFKAPSAWAEREVKYRQDKKNWEEEKRAMESEMTALRVGGGVGIAVGTAGRAAPGGGGGDGDGDGRLVELEAALLQIRREKDGALAQLHELQLSMRVDGEFGKDGVRESPYKGPSAAEALGAASFADKSVMMGKLEELEGENRKLRQELAAVRPVNLRLAVDGANHSNSSRGNGKDAAQLIALQRDLEQAAAEKTALQAQVHAAKGGVVSVEEVEIIRQQLVEAECVRDRLAGELHGLEIVAGTTSDGTCTTGFSDVKRIQELTSRLAAAETEAAGLQSALDDAEQYSQAASAAASSAVLQLNINDGTAHSDDASTTTNHHHPVVAAALFSGEGMSGQLAALNEQLARARVNRQALQEEMSKKTETDSNGGDHDSSTSCQLQVSYDKTRATETRLVAELAVLRQHENDATTAAASEDMTAAMSEQLTASRAVYEAMSKQIASLEMKLKQQREETSSAESIVLNLAAGGGGGDNSSGELEEAKMKLEEAKHKEQTLLAQLADLRPITLNLAVKDQQQRSQVSAPAAAIAAEDNTVQIAATAASSALQHQIQALEQQLKRQKASKEGLQEALKQTTATAPFPSSGGKNNESGATAALELALAKERLREEILMSRLDNLKDPAMQSQQSSSAAAASLVNTLQGKIAALRSQVAERKRESLLLKAELAEKVQLDNGDHHDSNKAVVVELKMKLEEAEKREAMAVAQLQDLQPVKLHLAVAQAAENAHADAVNISFDLSGDAISGDGDQNEGIAQSLAAAREVYGSTQKNIDELQGHLSQHRALQAQLKEQTTTKAEIQTQLAVLEQTGASSDDDAITRLQSELAQVESKEMQLVQEIAALQTVTTTTTTTTTMAAPEMEGTDGELTAQQQEARLAESISSQLAASEMLRTGMQKQVAALKAAMARAKADSQNSNASPEEAEAAKKKEEVLQARLENLQPVLDELEGLEQSAAATAAAVESSGIKLNINVADSGTGTSNVVSTELQEKLAAAEAREADLQSKLREAMAAAPVNLRFNLVSGSSDNHNYHQHHSSAVTAPGGLSRNSSSVSLKYSPEQASQLARDRAAADAEWEEYAKNSDLSALQRTKAELETKVHMLEQKIAEADEDKALLQQGVEAVIKTGDVSALTSLADRLKAGKSYLGGRISPVSKKLFRRSSSTGKKQPSQDGGAPSSGGKGNSVKKSFSDKFGSKKSSSTSASPLPIAEEEDDLDLHVHHVSTPMAAFNAAAAAGGGGGGGDEYELLMEHLVATKVRLAESEGDRLESRRALIRAKEKQLEQIKMINELKAALRSGNGGGGGGLTSSAVESGGGGEDELVGGKTEHATPGSEKKRGLRIPGIEINLR